MLSDLVLLLLDPAALLKGPRAAEEGPAAEVGSMAAGLGLVLFELDDHDESEDIKNDTNCIVAAFGLSIDNATVSASSCHRFDTFLPYEKKCFRIIKGENYSRALGHNSIMMSGWIIG